jgi:hypothetical protein
MTFCIWDEAIREQQVTQLPSLSPLCSSIPIMPGSVSTFYPMNPVMVGACGRAIGRVFPGRVSFRVDGIAYSRLCSAIPQATRRKHLDLE